MNISNQRWMLRRITFSALLGLLFFALLPYQFARGASDTVDTNGEQYRDIQQDLAGNIIGNVPGEYYDALSGSLRYYATDFYIPGNGDLPIFIERTLDSAKGGKHEFGHMKLLYNRLSFDSNGKEKSIFDTYGSDYDLEKLFYRWQTTIRCDREHNNCNMIAENTAITHVPNACEALRHKYVYVDWSSGISNTIDYIGVVFPAPKFYVGNGKYVRFYLKSTGDARFPANATLVSSDNWFIDCVDSATMNVYSPDGIVYEIKRQILTGSYFDESVGFVNYGPEDSYYTTKIADKSGNTITFEYDKVLTPTVQISPATNDAWDSYERPKLTRIVASDGRELNFEYSNKQISRIYDNSTLPRSLSYHYGVSRGRDLERVTRSDGREWTYTYDYHVLWETGWDAGIAILLKDFSTPEGLGVHYTYNMRLSCEFYNEAYVTAGKWSTACVDRQQIPVLESRALSGSSLPSGMSYGFSYGNSGNRAITTITTPSGKHRIEFGYLNLTGTAVTEAPDAGKPTRHITYGSDGSSIVRETTWTWTKLYDVIDMGWANTYWDYRPVFPLSGMFPKTYLQTGRRVVTQTTTSQEGSQFQRTRSNHDNYGYPQTLVETSTLANGGGTHARTTDQTYHNDANEWIIGLLEDETIEGEGTIDRDYYANGKLRYEDRFGIRTDYSYNQEGDLAERSWVKDGVKQTYQYQDYFRGIPRTEINALQVPMYRTVADYGKVLTETDFNGGTTTYEYDDLYRVKRIISPESSYADTVINWSTDGLTQTTTRGNYHKIVNYDSLIRPINTREGDITRPTEEIVKSISYDAAGRVKTEDLPQYVQGDVLVFVGYEYTYDTLNRVISKRFTADNRTISTCYGPDCNSTAPYSRLGGVTFGQITQDERGYLTTTNYRAYGSPEQAQVVDIRQETSSSPLHYITTTIDRNLMGQMTQVDQGGYTRHYDYYPNKLLERLVQPEIGDTVYTYDEAGNRKTRTVGTGPTTEYFYDANNRLTTIDYPGNTQDVSYTYDDNGNVLTANVGGGNWSYNYNYENQLNWETLDIDSKSFVVEYGYDTLGHRNQIVYPAGDLVTQTPDALGRVRSIDGYVTAADYHANGQVGTIEYANGQVLSVTENTRGLPESMLTQRSGSVLAHMTYHYDDSSNISAIDDSILGNKSMGYDGVSRLTTANGPWGSGSITYDDVGNILTKSIGTKSLTYHYNSTTNLLESVAGTEAYSFGYDIYGNVTNNSRHTFSYDDANNMLASGSNTYQYDANNRRIKVDRGGTVQYYVYSKAGKLMYRYTPSSGKSSDYIYLAGQLVARHDRAPDPLPIAAAPAITPDGGSYEGTAQVTLSSSTPGAIIRYTVDGTTPSAASPAYSAPITLTSNATLKAMTVADGYQNSSVTQAVFTITANPDSDGDGMLDSWEITYFGDLSHDGTADSDGDGLTDLQEYKAGTDPNVADSGTQAGELLSNPGFEEGADPWVFNNTHATRELVDGSWVARMERWQYGGSVEQSVPATAGVTYTAAGEIRTEGISGSVVHIQLRFYDASGNQLDNKQVGVQGGTNPFTRYEASFTAPSGTTRMTILGLLSLDVTSGYAYMDNFSVRVAGSTEPPAVVATPQITPAGGSYTDSVTVTLSSSTSQAVIHYTTDGTTPTDLSPIYDGPFTLIQSATVNAIAIANGYTDSAVATAQFTVTAASGYSLQVSSASDRSSPAGLNGTTEAGSIYVFVGPESGISHVDFYLDDPNMAGTPRQSEGLAPYDFAGTVDSSGVAVPFDTTTLADGSHSITALITLTGGGSQLVTANFTVANAVALELSPGSLALSAEQDTAAVSDTVSLSASNAASVTYAVSSDAAWLSVSAESSTAAPATLTVAADPSGLSPAVYTGHLTISANGYTAATLTVSFTVTAAQTGELLSNPGFEEGADPWVFNNTHATRELVDGSWVARLERWQYGGAVEQSVPATAGVTYTAAGDIRTEGISGSVVHIQLRFYDASGNQLDNKQVGVQGGTNPFTRYEASFTAPSGTTRMTILGLLSLDVTSGYAYMDNFSVRVAQ